MYLLLHGFSRRNSGDGLLVDLTLEALADAGIDQKDCVLVALDPESFPDLENVYRAPGEPTARPSLALAGAAVELVADRLSLGSFSHFARAAKGMVAVGGGYLVADSAVRQAGVLLNHMVQLRNAARSAAPTIYLPQSVGPLQGPVGAMVKRYAHGIDRFYVRDDLTLGELGGGNLVRCADLAVMKLARELPQTGKAADTDAPVILVGRDLPKAGDYLQRLSALSSAIPSSIWAVQADIAGPRSDRAFYQRQQWADAGMLSDVMAAQQSGVVVSVRLHGAVAALLGGFPAIHLAYERKGWGAYEDLGIAEFVHDARTFDPAKVAAQVHALQASPAQFWDAVAAAAPRLRSQYAAMVEDLRTRLAG